MYFLRCVCRYFDRWCSILEEPDDTGRTTDVLPVCVLDLWFIKAQHQGHRLGRLDRLDLMRAPYVSYGLNILTSYPSASAALRRSSFSNYISSCGGRVWHGTVEVCEGAPVAMGGWVLADVCALVLHSLHSPRSPTQLAHYTLY